MTTTAITTLMMAFMAMIMMPNLSRFAQTYELCHSMSGSPGPAAQRALRRHLQFTHQSVRQLLHPVFYPSSAHNNTLR
jgi:hypothetical protein